MKLQALLVVLLVALTFALAGCGNNAESSGSGGAPTGAQPPVTVPDGGGAPSSGPMKSATKAATAPTN